LLSIAIGTLPRGRSDDDAGLFVSFVFPAAAAQGGLFLRLAYSSSSKMGLGCGAKFLKYCLFAFNLIFVIAGLVCLGVGIWLISDKHAMDNLDTAMAEAKVKAPNMVTDYKGMPTAVRNLGIVLAAGGGIILVIAFLGCCGAVKEWRPMLVLYAIFLMVILAVEIAAAIYAAVNRTSFETEIQNGMEQSLRVYGGEDSVNNNVRYAWDAMMNESQCCGVDPNFSDSHYGFHMSQWYTQMVAKCPVMNATAATPESYPYPPACVDKSKPITPAITSCTGYTYYTRNSVYPTGCYVKLKAVVENKMSIIIGVGVAVGLIQLIGILFAFCLCCSISSSQG